MGHPVCALLVIDLVLSTKVNSAGEYGIIMILVLYSHWIDPWILLPSQISDKVWFDLFPMRDNNVPVV